jgi:hypothetical protein
LKWVTDGRRAEEMLKLNMNRPLMVSNFPFYKFSRMCIRSSTVFQNEWAIEAKDKYE